ncbi:MAG: dTDP-4-dehydrorhamnose reductase [Verrucomicrobiota bacterium]|nr:dTDP-4-dehydrorhamnose reductase [Limisphaera sp.]MDW8380987.1 dTDP-4-dehydrorhamnose reductase [Verrucomicrobiota bacterium]
MSQVVPSMRRILLLGCRGQVGWELQRALAPLGMVVARDYPEVDLAQVDQLVTLVRETNPDVIVNAAAYTAVDRAEQEPEKARLINAVAPARLAALARERRSWLVHYSTDYVYDGSKRTPYEESDPPCPLNVYGQTKLEGDLAITTSGCPFLIFRLCWVYGTRGHNFLLTIQRLARERETLRVVADQIGSPTWSRWIAETTAQALGQVLAQPDPGRWSGIYHLRAAGQTSWHGFARRIVDLMPVAERRCREVVPIRSEEYPSPARRPAWSVMSCEKLWRTFRLALPDWETGLLQALDMS